MKPDEIDNILREKLARFELPPSHIPPLAMPTSKRSFTGWYLSVAVAVAACFVVGLLIFEPVGERVEHPAEVERIQRVDKVDAVGDSLDFMGGDVVDYKVVNRKANTLALVLPAEVEPEPTVEKVKDVVVVVEGEPLVDRADYQRFDEELISSVSRTQPRFAYRGYTSLVGGGVGSSTKNMVMADSRLNYGYSAVFAARTKGSELYRSEIAPLRESFTHRMPVTIGLSVDYSFNRRLALSSGLSFTYLLSQIKQQSISFSNYRQEVYYLGIPLGVTYKFVDGKLFDLYLAGGIEAEYAVALGGVSEREGLYGTSRTSVALDCNRFQFSVNAGVGAALRLSPTISLYVEPGVSHYFVNDNKPITYRTEKPTQFSLRTGLRITL